MTEEIKKKLDWYARKAADGKKEPMSETEEAAFSSICAALMGQVPQMPLEEANQIADAYNAKPGMTDQEWLDFEEEYARFFQKYLSEEDLKEYADSMVGDVLPMICDAIRMKHKNAYSEK